MKLIQISKSKTITITLVSLQLLLLASIFVAPVLGNESLFDGNKRINKNVKSLSETEFFSNNNTTGTVSPFTNQTTMPITNFGMWAPYQLPLESVKNITERKNAVNAILKQGYNEYYFTMADFRSKGS